jgi:hypothetical protein
VDFTSVGGVALEHLDENLWAGEVAIDEDRVGDPANDNDNDYYDVPNRHLDLLMDQFVPTSYNWAVHVVDRSAGCDVPNPFTIQTSHTLTDPDIHWSDAPRRYNSLSAYEKSRNTMGRTSIWFKKDAAHRVSWESVNAPTDCEFYDLRITGNADKTAQDGTSSTQTYTILLHVAIKNVNDCPVMDDVTFPTAVAEMSLPDTLVGFPLSNVASDEDQGQELRFAITRNYYGMFRIGVCSG